MTAASERPSGNLPPGSELCRGHDQPVDVAALVSAAVREEFDVVLPHVLAALKRDRAFDELTNRLSRAERRLEGRQERPLAIALHKLLNRLRHLDFDTSVKNALEEDLVNILHNAGFEEAGKVGDDYDPIRHEALGGRAVDSKAAVIEILATGLESVGDIIVRAQVRIVPCIDVRMESS